MVLRWDGGPPSDAREWADVLADALGEEATFYWVRFYRNPGGWRFDLERHGETPGPDGWSRYWRADESTARRVFMSLSEGGRSLDPSWTPFAASPPAGVVRMPRRADPVPAALRAPIPEPLPRAASAPPLTVVERPERISEMPPPDVRTTARPVSVAPASIREALPQSVSSSRATDRLRGWRSLRLRAWPRLRLPDWRRLAPAWHLRLPAWPSFRLPRWRGLRFPDWRGFHTPAWHLRLPPWPSFRRPGWRGLRVPDWRRLRVPGWQRLRLPAWRSLRLPEWRSLRPVLVYTPAVLLVGFAWWLSRDRDRPPPSPAPSQVIQTRPQEPGRIAQPSNTARPSARRRDSLPTRVMAQPSRRRAAVADVNDPGVSPPILVSQTRRPPYPPLALARGLSGTVWLNAVVDETGRVVEIALVRTSAPGLGFEDAAMTNAYWRVYRPATKRGVPVRFRLPMQVEFQVPRR